MHDKRRISKHTALTIAAGAAICAFALFLFSHNEADVDLWGNAGFVQALPGSAGFHLTNTFSFTEPDLAWVNHEWLSEYILNRTYHHFGNPGLLLLKIALGFALLYIMNRSMRNNCRSGAVRLLYLALIISTIGYGFSTRPHLFTYLLFAALLSALIKPRPSIFVMVLATPLGCLWANLHGAFFIGQLMLLITTICAALKVTTGREHSLQPTLMLATASLAFFGGTLINPYGIQLWSFIFDSAAIARPVLSEWAPLNLSAQFGTHIDFIALAIITTISVLASIRRSSVLPLIFLLLALIAAITMRRNIPLFAIVAAIVATRHVDDTIGWQIDNVTDQLPQKLKLLLLGSGAAICILFFARANRTAPLQIHIPRDQFPIEAVTFLERNKVEANAIVFFDWAEYCIWKLHPRCRVFLDGRFRSAYSEDTIRAFMQFIYAGPNALDAINNYPTDLVLVHVGNPCTKIMRELEGWQLVYQDKMAAIFVKRSAHKLLLRNLAMKSAYLPSAPESDLFP